MFPRRPEAKTLDFLVACLKKLPSDIYGVYVSQLAEGIVRYVGDSEFDNPSFRNYVSFTYNPKISVKYQDWNGRFWLVRGITVENRNQTEKTKVSIFFSHGLVCGYTFESGRDFDPDPGTIDVSNTTQEFVDSPDPIVKSLLSSRDQELINWSDVYEVEVEGKTYFHLRDIGDGDFIGIDENSRFYEIRHDPIEVIGLDGSLGEIFNRYLH